MQWRGLPERLEPEHRLIKVNVSAFVILDGAGRSFGGLGFTQRRKVAKAQRKRAGRRVSRSAFEAGKIGNGQA
jgi:hypothetical protein